MHEQEDVSLANLKNGEVVGLADFKLKELYADIQDPNKSGEARELTIKIKIKPNANRDFGTITTIMTTKLAKDLPVETQVFLAVTKDGPVATEYNPAQQSLPMDTAPSKVTHLKTVGGN